jgi:hypothetical protein
MTTEQAIMSAVVRTDMFLVIAWRYGLAGLAVVMLAVIVMIRRKR